MDTVILSIDCGTQSLRAILFDLKGNIIDIEKIAYEPYESPNPGWAEKDAEVYWETLCQSCNILKERSPDAFDKIKGVGITTMRGTMINLDKEGNPLRNSIVWLDQRKAKAAYHFNSFFKLIFKALNVDEILEKMKHQGNSNWIKQEQPEIWEKTHKYVQVSGYLNHRLTGEFKDSRASQIGHIPFDYKK